MPSAQNTEEQKKGREAEKSGKDKRGRPGQECDVKAVSVPYLSSQQSPGNEGDKEGGKKACGTEEDSIYYR